MKKRILAIAMALIMLTGTSPLMADASEILNEPATDAETLADAPVEETDEVETLAVISEEAEPAASTIVTNESNSEIEIDAETITPDAEPTEVPASKAEQDPAKAPAQENPEKESEKETEQETPATPSNVPEETEIPVEEEELVEIEEEETPLAGPVANMLSFDNNLAVYSEDGRKNVFVVNGDGSIGDFNNPVTYDGNKEIEEYTLYAVPGCSFEIERKKDWNNLDGAWWCWSDTYSGVDSIEAKVTSKGGGIGANNGTYSVIAPTQNHAAYWLGGYDTQHTSFKATVKIGAENNALGKSSILRVVKGDRQAGSKDKINEGYYWEINTPEKECRITIRVVKWVNIRYMKNTGKEEYSLEELGCNTDGLGVTYGYYTPEAGIDSQTITVPQAPAKSGYEFTGWKCIYTDSNGSEQEKIYQPGETFEIPSAADMELYAQWKYKVESYKDGSLDKTEFLVGIVGESVPEEKYADKRYEGYRLQKIEGSTEISANGGDPLLKVYYVSKAGYTINYYKDDIEAKPFEVESGTASVNTKIKDLPQYTEDRYFGYTFVEAKGAEDISGKAEENILHVYYKKSSGDLKINVNNGSEPKRVSTFRITCDTDPEFSMEVAVTDAITIKNLPATPDGTTYKVKEIGGWSWDCSGNNRGEKNGTVKVGETVTVDFGSLGSRVKYWFGAEAQEPNNFGAIKEQKGGTNE